MSSDPQSALQLLVMNDYASVVIVTVVTYDYFLTFSKEVEFIWRRPWTLVSTIFLFVRYIGLLSAIANALVGSSFFPGPPEVIVSISNFELITVVGQGNSCAVVDILSRWTFIVFLFATDLGMILRVYAMWNRSKWILWILLSVYMLQITTTVVIYGLYTNPAYLAVTIAQLSMLSFCDISLVNMPLALTILIIVPQLTLAAMLVMLAVTQTVRQSVEIYKTTKQRQLNRYMRLLIREGILYFFINVANQTTSLLLQDTPGPVDGTTLFLSAISFAIFYPLIPRFILSIRALYDRDIDGRLHVDTGFGVRSRLNVGLDTTVSAMVFADDDREQQAMVEGDGDSIGDVQEVRRALGQVWMGTRPSKAGTMD